MPKTVDSMVSDLVGTFTDPILVFPGGWGDTLPDWIKGAITMDRLEANIRASRGEELYGFILKDAKVPDTVIKGVGKFIDFRKYLGVAVDRGTKEVCKRIEEILGTTR